MGDGQAKMIAQEIHLDYSNDFFNLITEGEIEDGTVLDPDVDDEQLIPDKP